MAEPIPTTTSGLGPLDWACVAYNLTLAIAGAWALRDWARLTGRRHEPMPAEIFFGVPAGMLMLSCLAFGVVFPLTMQGVMSFFVTSFGIDETAGFIATLAGQAAAAAVMLTAWLTLPHAISWGPTIGDQGDEGDHSASLRAAWKAFGVRPWLRSFLCVCALACVGALGWKGIHRGWEALHAAGLTGAPPADELQDIVEVVLRTDVLSSKFTLLSLAVVIGAPLMEELVFRGALYPALKHLGRGSLGEHAPRYAAVLTGIAFSWAHLTPSTYLPLFLFGWFLCLVRDRHGLLTCIAVHAAFNLSNLAWLKLAPDVANL